MTMLMSSGRADLHSVVIVRLARPSLPTPPSLWMSLRPQHINSSLPRYLPCIRILEHCIMDHDHQHPRVPSTSHQIIFACYIIYHKAESSLFLLFFLLFFTFFPPPFPLWGQWQASTYDADKLLSFSLRQKCSSSPLQNKHKTK